MAAPAPESKALSLDIDDCHNDAQYELLQSDASGASSAANRSAVSGLGSGAGSEGGGFAFAVSNLAAGLICQAPVAVGAKHATLRALFPSKASHAKQINPWATDGTDDQAAQLAPCRPMDNAIRLGTGAHGRVYNYTTVEYDFVGVGAGTALACKDLRPTRTHSDPGPAIMLESYCLEHLNGRRSPGFVQRCEDADGRLSHFQLFMTLAAGQCLANLPDVSKGKAAKMADEDSIPLAREILFALRELHDLDVCHRDLKPSNIFWDPKGDEGQQVMFVDFGSAAHVDHVCESATYGTNRYTRLDREGVNAADIDLFGLACTLESMTGRMQNQEQLVRWGQSPVLGASPPGQKGEATERSNEPVPMQLSRPLTSDFQKAATIENFIDFCKLKGHPNVDAALDHPWLAAQVNPDLQDSKAASSQSPVKSA